MRSSKKLRLRLVGEKSPLHIDPNLQSSMGLTPDSVS
jgi:hypothetical protein